MSTHLAVRICQHQHRAEWDAPISRWTACASCRDLAQVLAQALTAEADRDGAANPPPPPPRPAPLPSPVEPGYGGFRRKARRRARRVQVSS